MDIRRRDFVVAAGVAAASGFSGFVTPALHGAGEMYGLIGKMIAAEGQRDALIDILLQGVMDMPGCLSYVIARDPADSNALWITEVWDSEASHAASLSLPAVKSAIAKGRPLIAGFGERFVTSPVGGHGLPRR
jgi:quinol monooxygenase YgiN